MHRKHLLPGFDDRTSDEAAINNLTSEITDVKIDSIFFFLVSGEGTDAHNFFFIRNFIELSEIFNGFE